MVSIKTNIRPEEVRHKSQHVLFVEGSDIDSVDPTVLSELFNNILTVKPLGASFHIKSAAEALYTHHPTYYFLIDRDHHDEKIVDEYWSTFPDPEKCNLLIWRRREIENYFLDPEYLGRSEYCRVDQGTLEKKYWNMPRKDYFWMRQTMWWCQFVKSLRAQELMSSVIQKNFQVERMPLLN